MYSSQEIVLGAGAVRDCLLTGCRQEHIIQWHYHSHQNIFVVYNQPVKSQHWPFISPQSSAHWCCLLYSSSPWWLCSSGCPPHWGAPAVSLTLAPDRSLHRSQLGSFQSFPIQKQAALSVCHDPVISSPTAHFLRCTKKQTGSKTVLKLEDATVLIFPVMPAHALTSRVTQTNVWGCRVLLTLGK